MQRTAVERMSRDELETEIRDLRATISRLVPDPPQFRCGKPLFPVGCRLDDGHEGKCLPYPSVPAGGNRFA